MMLVILCLLHGLLMQLPSVQLIPTIPEQALAILVLALIYLHLECRYCQRGVEAMATQT